MENNEKEVLFSVSHLKKYFQVGNHATLKAVDDVSFEIYKGETLGMVGESGCGKTTCGRTCIGLYDKTDGQVLYKGTDVHALNGKERFAFKKQVQMVFQDPYASLDPRMTIGDIVGEPIDIHHLAANKAERREKIISLLERVGLNSEHANRYPHEFSGGQRQRVGIARALAVDPEFIVCDEPVSALDVSIQAQVINLLHDLQERMKLTYLFIAHDLNIVKYISDRIAVMKDGHIMQIGTPRDIYAKPQNPFVAGFIGVSNFLDCEVNAPAPGNAAVSIKGELDITVPVSRAYTGSGKISARPEQLFFSESGMPGTILFSTFLGDFIEYEVQLNDGQNLIVNEYTKDTTEIHSDGEQVHLSFDPMRISLYDKSEEVLSL